MLRSKSITLKFSLPFLSRLSRYIDLRDISTLDYVTNKSRKMSISECILGIVDAYDSDIILPYLSSLSVPSLDSKPEEEEAEVSGEEETLTSSLDSSVCDGDSP